jgi:hypothetical protein
MTKKIAFACAMSACLLAVLTAPALAGKGYVVEEKDEGKSSNFALKTGGTKPDTITCKETTYKSPQKGSVEELELVPNFHESCSTQILEIRFPVTITGNVVFELKNGEEAAKEEWQNVQLRINGKAEIKIVVGALGIKCTIHLNGGIQIRRYIFDDLKTGKPSESSDEALAKEIPYTSEGCREFVPAKGTEGAITGKTILNGMSHQ